MLYVGSCYNPAAFQCEAGFTFKNNLAAYPDEIQRSLTLRNAGFS